MGNDASSASGKPMTFDNFYEVVNHIASHYILTMDFQSLNKLSEKEYCDKLVVLTADILDKHYNEREVEFLAQRIKQGQEVNEMERDKFFYINRDKLESLDVSHDRNKSIRKKRVCIGIAKFYIKIAHVFAAIVTTINPVYTFTNDQGETVKVQFMDKDTIPKNARRKLYKLNICDNRIRALKHGQKDVVEENAVPDSVEGEAVGPDSGTVSMQPKICDMNLKADGTLKTLADEPGIQELMRLYLDDNYDYATGAFTGMSEATKAQYQRDLKTFYTAFTGEETMPPEIQQFSDIKLRDYQKSESCQVPNGSFRTKYRVSKNSDLYEQYAANLRDMIQNAAANQMKLLTIINGLFAYTYEPISGKQIIRINPTLTEAKLQELVVQTRKFIINLYVTCEKDYVRGIKLYEAIVEKQILATTQKQIESLKQATSQMVESVQDTLSNSKPIPVATLPSPAAAASAPPVSASAPAAAASAPAVPLGPSSAPAAPAPAPAPTVRTELAAPSSSLPPTYRPPPQQQNF